MADPVVFNKTRVQIEALRDVVAENAATTKPLTLYQADTNKVGVYDGTVRGQRPTLGGTALDNDPPPTATISRTRYFWIKAVCLFATEEYTLTIEQTDTDAPPGDPAISSTGFTSYFYIGYAEWDAGAIAAIVNEYTGGNLGVDSFGAYNRWWRL